MEEATGALVLFPGDRVPVQENVSICRFCEWLPERRRLDEDQAVWIERAQRLTRLVTVLRSSMPVGLTYFELQKRMHEMLVHADEEVALLYWNQLQLYRGR